MNPKRWLVWLLAAASSLAQAITPEPAPMPQKETLTIGYVKVGHLAPMVGLEETLKKMNIEVKRAEFVRYADARTALISGSVDVSAIGPGDLAIAASQGSRNLIGLTGVAGSPKYLVVRKGVKIDEWKDIAGKKIGVAPGSAVWFQWAMTLVENNVPYASFSAVNIQGGGTAFVQALKRGDIDAFVLWEPFESQVVADDSAYFAKKLEYSQSRSVGAELGMLATTRDALTNKREVVRRFLWAYLKAEDDMAKNPALFAEAYSRYTGLPLDVTKESSKIIKLGGVINTDQIKRQAEAAFKQGVIQKDVTNDVAALYDETLAREIRR
jgi:sulfonate transport system substrate-binding protein